MGILFSNEILASVSNELSLAKKSVQIISAFCKEEALKSIAGYVNSGVKDKRLMVRFKLSDLLNGSTDFSIVKYCIDNGWELYIRFDLHAKTYIVDNMRGIITSANSTNRGLSIKRNGNIEMGTLVDIEAKDVSKIENLYKNAIHMDQKLYEKMKKQYEEAKLNDDLKRETVWGDDIVSMFKKDVTSLFSYELPEKNHYEMGDYIEFMDIVYEGNKKEVKEAFKSSNVYIWLKSVLDGCEEGMYFGKITQLLHDAVITDPKPYRRDVKQSLVNIISLIEEFEIDDILIDRPRYSQRIRLNKKGD